MLLRKSRIFLTITFLLTANLCFGAVEDFTTYTEVDNGGTITKTATRCTLTNTETRNTDGYVYADKTAGYFGDFTHSLTIFVSSMQFENLIGSVIAWWGLSNTVGDQNDWDTASDPGFNVDAYSTTYDIEFWNNDQDAFDTYNATQSTIYYLTVSRSGTTGLCLIYSDSARTTLLDTLSLTVSATTLRYVYCAAGWNNENFSELASCYTENLDLVYVPVVTDTAIVTFVN